MATSRNCTESFKNCRVSVGGGVGGGAEGEDSLVGSGRRKRYIEVLFYNS